MADAGVARILASPGGSMRVEGRISLGEPEVSGAPDGVEHTRARELGVERVRAGAATSA